MAGIVTTTEPPELDDRTKKIVFGTILLGMLVSALDQTSSGGFTAEPVFAPARAGEVQRSCLDVGRAERELGWRAEVTLTDGLRRILSGLGA